MVNKKKDQVLFLTLRTFSMTGGIENVCKGIAYHFNSRYQEGTLDFGMISLYDEAANPKYIDASLFNGYAGQRLKGFYEAVRRGIQQKLVILSHINLAPIGLLIKLLSPRTKLVLWTHGIEVWRPIDYIKKTFLKKVDEIVAVSSFTANSLKEWHGLDLKKVKVIPNALDPFYVFPDLTVSADKGALLKKYGLESDFPLLMATCRIKSSEILKNYDKVIAAIGELKKEGMPCYYFLCGKYEADEAERLKKVALAAGVENEFILTGFLTDEELLTLQKCADAFVLPSQKEGFGLVFIEAQAAGLRVIAGNRDGSAEAVKNQEAGVLVDAEVKAISSAMRDWAFQPLHLNEKLAIQVFSKKHYSFQKFSKNISDNIIING